MAIADWSARRVAILWVVGGVLEAALLVGPPVLARRWAVRNLPRLERQLAQMEKDQAAVQSRWRLAEQADSTSVAAQRRAAIRAGEFSVTPQGDTLVALVRMPSGAPESARVAAFSSHATRAAIGSAIVLWGAVPLVLVSLTTAWLFARRRNSRAPAAA